MISYVSFGTDAVIKHRQLVLLWTQCSDNVADAIDDVTTRWRRYWCTDQVIVQRVLSARTEADGSSAARLGSLGLAMYMPACLLPACLPQLAGLRIQFVMLLTVTYNWQLGKHTNDS